MTRQIKAHSFDFDGCIFHVRYNNKKQNSAIDDNQPLFASIHTQHNAAKYDEAVLFVGSARQSHGIDLLNRQRRDFGFGGRETESCFAVMEPLRAEIEKLTGTTSRVDPFLQADIVAGKPAGHSFALSLQTQQNPEAKIDDPHPDCIPDKSKLLLLYAQIHKLATENPDADIDFSFYDDREGLLDALKRFFRSHPSLLPTNVKLSLYVYNGTAMPERMIQIAGCGMIDTKYEANTLKMSSLSGHDVTQPKHPFDVHEINPLASNSAFPVAAFKRFRNENCVRSPEEERERVNALLKQPDVLWLLSLLNESPEKMLFMAWSGYQKEYQDIIAAFTVELVALLDKEEVRDAFIAALGAESREPLMTLCTQHPALLQHIHHCGFQTDTTIQKMRREFAAFCRVAPPQQAEFATQLGTLFANAPGEEDYFGMDTFSLCDNIVSYKSTLQILLDTENDAAYQNDWLPSLTLAQRLLIGTLTANLKLALTDPQKKLQFVMAMQISNFSDAWDANGEATSLLRTLKHNPLLVTCFKDVSRLSNPSLRDVHQLYQNQYPEWQARHTTTAPSPVSKSASANGFFGKSSPKQGDIAITATSSDSASLHPELAHFSPRG